MRAAGIWLVLLSVAFAAAPAAGADCPTVVRVALEGRSQLEALAAWTEPWEVGADGRSALIAVGPEGLERLSREGLRYEVDRRRTARYCSPLEPLEGQRSGIPGYPCYRTVDETFAAAAALVADHPDLAEWLDVGDSWERTSGLAGHDMAVLRLGNAATAGTPTGTDPPHGKPRLFVTSAIHARELATAELMTRFAEELLDGYGTDADATWLLDEHEIHLMLQANPDARVQAEAGQLWRKNTNQSYCGPTSSSRGADLNRNFAYRFGCCGGSSGLQCSETYRGAGPASEPETQAVQSWARAIFPDQRGGSDGDPAPDGATGLYIDVHSYGGLVLWPWGFTPTPPPNGDGLEALGRRLAARTGYSPSQSTGLYTTDGTTCDFVYGDLGVAAITFEIGTDFFQDCSAFESRILPDNLEALRYAAKVARAPYLLSQGPDAAGVAPSSAVVAPGEPVEIVATLDDTRSRGGPSTDVVVSARLTVDVPPWRDPAPPEVAMVAADGAFDSPVEPASAVLDTTGLADGRHVVFVRGTDATGADGPVSAAFFWVLDPASAPRVAGTVRDAADGTPLAATISSGPFSAATDPATGTFDLVLPAGEWLLEVTADGYAPARTGPVALANGQTVVRNLALAPYQTRLADDVESGNIGWTAAGGWAITAAHSASPTHSWTDSPGGDYPANSGATLTSPELVLTGVADVALGFAHRHWTEAGWDYARVEVSADGGASWSEVATFDGASNGWETVELPLPALDGAASARIRFRMDADSWIEDDGWYVDDVVVRGVDEGLLGPLFGDGFESGDAGAWSSVAGG